MAEQMSESALREEIARLAPWHLEVELAHGLSTGLFREAEINAEQMKHPVSFIDPKANWLTQMSKIFPDGLAERTVLDCACNCGGYSFWALEAGGGGGLAFDVRERWIEQARFLQDNRTQPSASVRFEVCSLYDLPSLTEEEFDIAIFQGILYHLADPIGGLRIVADRTRELLIVNTAARNDLPDGMLAISNESVEEPMSGVDGVAWFPTGPNVIARMLASMGFPESRCMFWRRDLPAAPAGYQATSSLGRLEVLAARDRSTFEHFDRWRPDAALR